MDKTAIKNFAIWARVNLMEDIRTRLGLLGITEDGISDPMPASTNEVKYFDIGADHPVSIKGKAIHQREQLAEEIRKAGKESNYQSAYRNFIESSAYDWFNRLIAIRYMEVNEYAPLDVRLLSSVEPGKQDPDLVSMPFDGSLEYSESETQQILAWKEQHDNNKLFRFLLFKMCNQLHEVLPGIFEARDDASELLMRQSFIDKDGIIHHLVNDIPEEDWKDQVQIIGWIYQYYNTELNSQVYDGRFSNDRISKELLPAATTIYTPDWPIRYMVENSLGKLWIEHLRGMNPDVDEKTIAEQFGWKYYLPEAKQEPEVEQKLAKIREEYAALKPEDLSCLDPCMGSGHILVYMFDVLQQIYTSVGYSEREAAKAILENNIYGLDIDDRAYQLAYFAVMMKARQYNRRILTSGIKAHIYSIQESNGITRKQFQEMGENLSPEEKAKALSQAEKLVELFHDAKEYGSILNIPEMDWELLRRFVTPKETLGQISLNWNQEASDRLMQLIDQGEVMAQKYWVICTNPPYFGSGRFSDNLLKFSKVNYPEEKMDLSMMMLSNSLNEYCISKGFVSFITTSSVLFLTSFKKIRDSILDKYAFDSLVDFGTELFDGKVGHNPIAAYTIRKEKIDYSFTAIRLVDYCFSRRNEKENQYFNANNIYHAMPSLLGLIDGKPIAYWINDNLLFAFKNGTPIANVADVRVGLQTGDNNRFLRIWTEVPINNIDFNYHIGSNKKWVPHNKGGAYQKWFGNNEYIVNWKNNGAEIKNVGMGQCASEQFYFKKGISWANVSTGNISVRYYPAGIVFDNCAPTIIAEDKWLEYILGLMNSKVGQAFMDILSPNVHYTGGAMKKVPLIYNSLNICDCNTLVHKCIELAEIDAKNFEMSWEFTHHPLMIEHSTTKSELVKSEQITATYHIAECYEKWSAQCNRRFIQLKQNEEEINRLFITIYGLQDELKPEEEDKDVTVHKADLGRDIRSLISYTIGCMFGRYSLDKEGLIYAGGDWKSVQSVYKTFLPDQDNVIPITDQKYLDDDVVERICEFLTIVYGADTLEENLDFIAKALGNKGLTSREVIRNYMLNDFFKDHCKTYSVTGSGKRPIYWLFDSGKENAFKALVYMHRWDADTTGRVLLYAQHIQQKYETEIRAIDMMLDHITDARQKSTQEKRQEHLKKQLEELVDYEERLEHMANERISIDLDDGVKVNYEKVQTDRNGKKYQILAPIK